MVLIHDGRRHYYRTTTKNIEYYNCAGQIRERCSGAITVDKNTGVVTVSKTHTCILDPFLELKDDFYNVVKAEAVKTFAPPEAIYKNVLAANNRFENIRDLVPLDTKFRQMIYTVKRSQILPSVETYTDLKSTLSDPQWRGLNTIDRANIQTRTFSVERAPESQGLKLQDWSLVDMLFEQGATTIYFDNTDSVLPDINHSKELISVFVAQKGYAFPVSWFVLADSSPDLYRLTVITFKLGIDHAIRNKKIKFVTSGKWAPYIRLVFPDSTVKLNFHGYCMSLLEDAANSSLMDLKDAECRHTLVNLASISLLPAEKIPHAIAHLKSQYRLVPNKIEKMHNVLRNAEENYLNQETSFFNDLETCETIMLKGLKDLKKTTNDNLEIPIWDFYRFRLKQLEDAWLDLENLETRSRITKTAKIDTFITSVQLKTLWKNQVTLEAQMNEFLSLSHSHVDRFMENLILNLPSTIRQVPRQFLIPKCIRCLKNQINYIALPCHHLLYCNDCKLKVQPRECSICYEAINDFKKIFVNGDDFNCLGCIEKPRTIVTSKCGHLAYCSECIARFMDSRPEIGAEIPCPVCLTKSEEFFEVLLSGEI